MVEYSRSDIKRVNSSFIIEPFHKKKSEKKKESFRLIEMMDLGIYFIVPLLVGLGIGIYIDSRIGSKPIGVVCGLIFGMLSFFFNLLKIVREFSHHASNKH